jgi:hypothetical protein
MKTQSVSFRHACEILMNYAGMDLDESNVVGRSTELYPTIQAGKTYHSAISSQTLSLYH